MFQKQIQGPIDFETRLINANMLITLVRRYFQWFRVTKRQKSICLHFKLLVVLKPTEKAEFQTRICPRIFLIVTYMIPINAAKFENCVMIVYCDKASAGLLIE